MLQAKIDSAEVSGKDYDAIVLCLGLCGNATVGIKSRETPLVIPRVHDCCALFLGSIESWIENFGDAPSTPFSSAGYLEHGGDFVRETDTLRQQMGYDQTYQANVEKYGEENAKYIWETLHPKEVPGSDGRVVFIDVPECPSARHMEACRQQAFSDGKRFVRLEGSIEMIRKLIFGEWSEKDFLQVPPGMEIAGVYDWKTVVKAVKDAG
jgi:hypothetical protein